MEITIDLHFDPQQVFLLDMHSVLNVLNVVQYELVMLAEKLGYPSELEMLSEATADAGEDLVDPEKAFRQVETIGEFAAKVDKVLDGVLDLAVEKGEEKIYRQSRGNLRGIFEVLGVRAGEILARKDNPAAWEWYDICQLQENFTQFFQAIERNSKGGYHIVRNLAQHEDGDYLLNLEISSTDDNRVRMPPVFQDVMRDLLANARKYTVPGGTITAGLLDDGTKLRFVVCDTGCGIPQAELEEVVKFGYRARNVQGRPTRGGGFGLTKAYYITRCFGGRMWIESPVNQGQGTRVEIQLPRG